MSQFSACLEMEHRQALCSISLALQLGFLFIICEQRIMGQILLPRKSVFLQTPPELFPEGAPLPVCPLHLPRNHPGNSTRLKSIVLGTPVHLQPALPTCRLLNSWHRMCRKSVGALSLPVSLLPVSLCLFPPGSLPHPCHFDDPLDSLPLLNPSSPHACLSELLFHIPDPLHLNLPCSLSTPAVPLIFCI